MKELTIKKLNMPTPATAQEVPALLDKEQVEFQALDLHFLLKNIQFPKSFAVIQINQEILC